MKDLKHIIYKKSDGFGFITLNRPEVHNAMDLIMISEMTSLIGEISLDETVRAIVIRGKGKSFSSGADLNYMKSLVSASKPENLEDASRLALLFDTIYNCPLPVISVAHGNIFGGANGIIAASDITICTDNARFSFSELKLGLIPATVSPYIIRKIGESNAAELMFTGMVFNGLEACSYGLVNKAVKEEELESGLQFFLNEMSTSGPVALRKTKQLIRAISGKEIDSEIRRLTSRIIADIRISPEAQEGMKAFLEKRKPGWSK